MTTEPAVDAKAEVRKQTIDRTYEVLEVRTVYTEDELGCILKENYREERERNEWRDTSVTNTLKSLKGELLGRLNPRVSKGMKVNTHMIGQQWPQLEALLVHQVERIEELESADAHKQKRMEVLTRKIHGTAERTAEQGSAARSHPNTAPKGSDPSRIPSRVTSRLTCEMGKNKETLGKEPAQ